MRELVVRNGTRRCETQKQRWIGHADGIVRWMTTTTTTRKNNNANNNAPTITMTEYLFEKGADIETTDVRGRRALHYAVASENVRAVEFLLNEAKVSGLERFVGRTALDECVNSNGSSSNSGNAGDESRAYGNAQERHGKEQAVARGAVFENARREEEEKSKRNARWRRRRTKRRRKEQGRGRSKREKPNGESEDEDKEVEEFEQGKEEEEDNSKETTKTSSAWMKNAANGTSLLCSKTIRPSRLSRPKRKSSSNNNNNNNNKK